MNIGRLFRKKPNRYLTIKVITDTGSTTRNYLVSSRMVRWAKVGAVGLALFLVVGAIAIVDDIGAHRNMARLEIKAQQLRRQSQVISEMREELSEIWVINERLQRVLGAGTAPKDKRPVSHALPWGVPLAQWVGPAFKLKQTSAPEEGVYFYSSPGALVLATAEGTVTDIRWSPSIGDVLIIDHGDAVQTRYAADIALLVSPGDLVVQGQAIAVVRPTDGTRRPVVFYQVLAEGQSVNPLIAMATSPPLM